MLQRMDSLSFPYGHREMSDVEFNGKLLFYSRSNPRYLVVSRARRNGKTVAVRSIKHARSWLLSDDLLLPRLIRFLVKTSATAFATYLVGLLL